MADPQIVREWIEKANEDYEFASSVVEESPFYPQICFHFHQAAEKYLKALIIAWNLEFLKIHDLPVLLKACSGRKPDLDKLMGDCKFLNGFYIDTRYPVHWPTHYTKEEAFKAKEAAKHIRNTIKKVLGVEFHEPLKQR